MVPRSTRQRARNASRRRGTTTRTASRMRGAPETRCQTATPPRVSLLRKMTPGQQAGRASQAAGRGSGAARRTGSTVRFTPTRCHTTSEVGWTAAEAVWVWKAGTGSGPCGTAARHSGNRPREGAMCSAHGSRSISCALGAVVQRGRDPPTPAVGPWRSLILSESQWQRRQFKQKGK